MTVKSSFSWMTLMQTFKITLIYFRVFKYDLRRYTFLLGSTVIVEFKTWNSKEEYVMSESTITNYIRLFQKYLVVYSRSEIGYVLGSVKKIQRNREVDALKFAYCQPDIVVLHGNKHSKSHDFNLDGTTIREPLTDLTDPRQCVF